MRLILTHLFENNLPQHASHKQLKTQKLAAVALTAVSTWIERLYELSFGDEFVE
jgi:hypothetical protein